MALQRPRTKAEEAKAARKARRIKVKTFEV